QGDEGGVAQVGQIHLRLLGEGRVGGHREKDIVGEQQQLLAVRVDQAVIEGDQYGVQLHVLQLVEQVDIGAENQVDVELAAAQLEPHDQLRHGLDCQRVERAKLEALGRETGCFPGLPYRFDNVLDQQLGSFFQNEGAFQRDQVAPLALEQRAAQRTFQRVDGAVYADVAGVQL